MSFKIGDLVTERGDVPPWRWWIVTRLPDYEGGDDRMHAVGPRSNICVPEAYFVRAVLSFGGPVRCNSR